VQTHAELRNRMPETPLYPAAVPGTGYSNIIRPDLTGALQFTTPARMRT
jgi:hypothetical protein